MGGVPLTLAMEAYDRHAPLFDGSVTIEGVELQPLDVRQSRPGKDGAWRHERMLRDAEFDAAEVSLSSYLISRDGDRPFLALPIFPRRLFFQSQLWCLRGSGLHTIADLAGRRVGLRNHQTTLSVLAKGELTHHYAVPWDSVTWVTDRDETLEVVLPDRVRVERLPTGTSVDEALLLGAVDALVLPHLPRVEGAGDAVRRLLHDPRFEERNYLRERGGWPVMHLIAVKRAVLDGHPWLAAALFDAFLRSFSHAARRWSDPNWSMLAWGQQELEEQHRLFSGDPWRNGLAANRAYLERFVSFAREQGLVERRLTMEDLFVASLLDT